jgi:hypothetical protein
MNHLLGGLQAEVPGKSPLVRPVVAPRTTAVVCTHTSAPTTAQKARPEADMPIRDGRSSIVAVCIVFIWATSFGSSGAGVVRA